MRDRIVVTVDPAAADRIDDIAQRLVKAGMAVDQILSASGIITGTVDPGRAFALGTTAGVAAVELDDGG